MRKIILCSLLATLFFGATAQLKIDRNAIFYIQDKGIVTVEGNLTSENNIQGDGYLILSAKQPSRINLNGFGISNLLINSDAPFILESDVSINSSLLLQSGLLQLNNHHLTLMERARITGSVKSYVQTNGTGAVRKMIAGSFSDYVIPLGTSQAYMPLAISTNGSNQRGSLDVIAKAKASDHKPLQARDYLNFTWVIRREGSLQNITASGQYRLNDVEGSAGRLSSYYWNGATWAPQSMPDEIGKVSAKITSDAGELYAMNDVISGVQAGIKLLNNPARSFTSLEINVAEDKMYHVEVVDVTGRRFQQRDIKAAKGINRHTIYLNGLAAGTYFVNVSSADDKQSFKVLKID